MLKIRPARRHLLAELDNILLHMQQKIALRRDLTATPAVPAGRLFLRHPPGFAPRPPPKPALREINKGVEGTPLACRFASSQKMKTPFSVLRAIALAFALAACTARAVAQVPDALKQSFFDPDTAPQAGAQQGASVASDGDFVVVGAPLDDIDGYDVGLVKVYHAVTGALLHTLANPEADAIRLLWQRRGDLRLSRGRRGARTAISAAKTADALTCMTSRAVPDRAGADV